MNSPKPDKLQDNVLPEMVPVPFDERLHKPHNEPESPIDARRRHAHDDLNQGGDVADDVPRTPPNPDQMGMNGMV